MKNITKKEIIIIFVISFMAITLLKDINFFEPIFYYITAVHEMCHAFFALISGGKVGFIDLSNHGGVTGTMGGFFPIISMGGYIGTTIIGLILILMSQKEALVDWGLRIFSVIMLIMYITYMKSYINIYFISTLAITLIIFGSTYLNNTKYLSIVLGSFFIFDSFSDAKVYLFSKITGESNIIYQTDAGILARHIGLEILALPIAIFIFLFNMFLLYLTIKYLFKNNINVNNTINDTNSTNNIINNINDNNEIKSWKDVFTKV